MWLVTWILISTIAFTEKDGVLDIQIEGYKDMTEAARDFIRFLKEEWSKEEKQ